MLETVDWPRARMHASMHTQLCRGASNAQNLPTKYVARRWRIHRPHERTRIIQCAAPAIVISSLGGLVHGKDGLTARDLDRARMLRKVLKTQLGRPRGPPPRGQSYAWPIDPDETFDSEVIHHRVLSAEDDINSFPENHYDDLGISSRTRARINTRAVIATATSRNLAARDTCKRGWRVQGLLAGEWRDHLGRRRRARPTETGVVSMATEGSTTASIQGSMSCAGTEVSFEGLVEELRERLPPTSPLMEMFESHQTGGDCTVAEAMAIAADNAKGGKRTDVRDSGEEGRDSDLGGIGMFGYRAPQKIEGQGEAEGSNALARTCTARDETAEPQLSPLGYRMRRAKGVAKASRAVQYARTGFGANTRPLLLPQQALFPDGSTCRLAKLEDDISPSAAMVAVAKAQERALPLLQVCARKVINLSRA